MAMKRFLVFLLLLLISSVCVAGVNNPGSSGSSGFVRAGAQINVSDQTGAVFLNALEAGLISTSLGGNTPANIDANGYPTGTLSSNLGLSPFLSTDPTFTGSTVQWTLLWPGTCHLQLVINVQTNLVSSSHATVTGGSNSTMTITTDGTSSAGNVVFTFSAPEGVNTSMYFPSGFADSCPTGGLALVRSNNTNNAGSSDLAAYNGGTCGPTYPRGCFTPEFLAKEVGLQSSILRAMGWSGVIGSNETTWAYRSTINTFGWGSYRYPPGAYGGTISGTNTYTIAAAPNTPGTWTDGEVIIGVITNANTSTTPTLNVNNRGAKTIVNSQGLALNDGDLAVNGIYTFVYNAILGEVIESPGGISPAIPIEVQVALANYVSASLWTNAPLLATDSWVNSWATYICGNLNSPLYFYPEYSNEVWNFAQTQTQLSYQIGLALGFPNANNEPYHGWYGLRVRQIMGNDIPTACAGHMSLVRRVLAMSMVVGAVSQAEIYRFNGNDLAPSGTGTGQGNATYNTYTGSANYTTSPNRPIDVVEDIGYAPYVAGENLCTGPDAGCTPNSNNVPFYNALLTAYEAPNLPAAIALVDSDLRNGQILAQTVTCSGTTLTTPLAHGYTAATTNVVFTVSGGTSCSGLVSGQMYQVDSANVSGNNTFTIKAYVNGVVSGSDVNVGSNGTGTVTVGATAQFDTMISVVNLYETLWEAAAASYDAGRPSGMAPLRMELYEGGEEPQGPTQGQCTGLGISDANCAANIAAAITAWKNDPTSSATTLVYANQFLGKDATTAPTFGLMPHSKTPAQLQLVGPNVWSLLPGDPTSTAYQTYTGWSQVTHN